MSRHIISFLTFSSLITNTFTLPAPIAAPESIDDAHYQAVQQYKNSMKCTVFDPPDPKTSISQCNNVCGEAVAKAIAAGQMGSTSCMILGGDIKWEVVSGDLKVAGAQCSCNNDFLNQFADLLMEALPVIAEIGCNILLSMVQLVVEVGSLAIPGVGEAIDGAMIAGIEAAKLISYSVDAAEAGAGVFSDWLTNGCGTSHLPPNLKKGFDVLNSANDLILPKGFKPPPGVPKGGGKPGKNDPNAPKSVPESPNNDLKTKSPPKTTKDDPKTSAIIASSPNAPSQLISSAITNPPRATDRSHSSGGPQSPSSIKACTQKQKRAPGDQLNNDAECDDASLHVTKITNSMPIIKTIQKQCDFAKHSQACYHYYSAIQNDARMSSVYTCRDNNKRVNGVKTRDWRIQHAKKGWEDYLPKSYMFHDSKEPKKLACERDEWPPGYFNPPNANRPGVVAPQLVRYIPSGENGGAAQQWTSFCDLEDGGLGNGQIRKAIGARKKPPPGKKFGDINEELVRLIRPGKEKVNKGKDGKETTTTEFDAQFTRAVYEITFDKHFARFPSKENDWGLRDNPCWPKDIVPNDPGWVLLTDDAFYKTAGPLELVAELQAQKALYKLAAPKDMVQRADIRQGLNPPSKRPFDLTEDGGLAIRGVNSSRRLTHEELQRDIQIIPCADNTCSQERKLLHDDEEGLIIPGTTISPPTLPSINIDSTPTIVPRANLEIRTNTRTPLSPELPAATKNSSSHGTLRNRRVL